MSAFRNSCALWCDPSYMLDFDFIARYIKEVKRDLTAAKRIHDPFDRAAHVLYCMQQLRTLDEIIDELDSLIADCTRTHP